MSPCIKYIFGPYTLDAAQGILLKEGVRVLLKPKVFQTLLVLVDAEGRVVSKEDLMTRVWPDAHVEDGNLLKNISLIRKVFNDSEAGADYIETIPKVGYRLKIPVVKEAVSDEQASTVRTQIITQKVPDSVEAKSKKKTKFLPAAVGVILFAVVAGSLGLILGKSSKRPFANFSITPISSLGEISEASLSPDGKMIAEVLRDQFGFSRLCLKNIDSTDLAELIPAQDVAYRGLTFSRDGKFLYFNWIKEDTTRTLYKVSLTGGAPDQVINLGNGSPICFSPDGRKIAYVREEKSNGTSTLFVADMDGGSAKPLISKKLPQFLSVDERPSWSPDGQMIAYVLGDTTGGIHFQVARVDLNDTREKIISPQTWIWARQVVWLSDGDSLLISAREKDEVPHLRLWTVSYADGSVHKMTNELGSYESSLNLSADSTSLLALQVADSTNIWVTSGADAQQVKQITYGNNNRTGRQGIDWTPDGRIVYTSAISGVDQIWIMNANGSEAKQLTDVGVNQHPSVSPDGRYIFYSSGRGAGTRIWRMDINGSNQVMITDGDVDLNPQSSCDGKWVYYSSNRSGKRAIWRTSVNGGQSVQVVEEPSELPATHLSQESLAYVRTAPGTLRKLAFYSPNNASLAGPFEFPGRLRSSLRWTNDGKGIQGSFSKNGSANIWTLPRGGGAPIRVTNFQGDDIRAFAWSRDGKSLACARSKGESLLVLIRDER